MDKEQEQGERLTHARPNDDKVKVDLAIEVGVAVLTQIAVLAAIVLAGTL